MMEIIYNNSDTLYTNDGHLIGMLDRDQRTAKYSTIVRHMCYQPSIIINNDNSSIKELIKETTKTIYCYRSNWKFNYVYKTFQNLKLVLIFLLYIVSIPCTLSAPTSRKMENHRERMESHPKWVNPCGIPSDNSPMPQNMDAPQVTDHELLKAIIGQAKMSFTKADRFKDEYVRKVFNNNFQQLHDLWKSNHYQWLPNDSEIPKNLGENVPADVLQNANLDETLLNVYTSLQKIAVGLEQIAWDQEDQNGPFLDNFRNAEFNLRAVLCEIQMALYNRGVTMRDDILRDSMSDEFRNIPDETSRNLRDFLIFRDYMNALEYTKQVFEHLNSNI